MVCEICNCRSHITSRCNKRMRFTWSDIFPMFIKINFNLRGLKNVCDIFELQDCDIFELRTIAFSFPFTDAIIPYSEPRYSHRFKQKYTYVPICLKQSKQRLIRAILKRHKTLLPIIKKYNSYKETIEEADTLCPICYDAHVYVHFWNVPNQNIEKECVDNPYIMDCCKKAICNTCFVTYRERYLEEHFDRHFRDLRIPCPMCRSKRVSKSSNSECTIEDGWITSWNERQLFEPVLK